MMPTLATVGFSIAQIAYPLMGARRCLQFMDATFFGNARIVQIEVNDSFPGTVS
jgi:hypothetical protein